MWWNRRVLKIGLIFPLDGMYQILNRTTFVWDSIVFHCGSYPSSIGFTYPYSQIKQIYGTSQVHHPHGMCALNKQFKPNSVWKVFEDVIGELFLLKFTQYYVNQMTQTHLMKRPSPNYSIQDHLWNHFHKAPWARLRLILWVISCVQRTLLPLK